MSTKHPHFAYEQESNRIPSHRRICDLPVEERPLYRLHHHGSNALSTTELLVLLLGTANAPGLSEALLRQFGSLHQLARANREQLMHIHGIGVAQAGKLMAVLELSRRLQIPPDKERLHITSPADSAKMLFPRLSHLNQEEFHIILLDTHNRVLDIQTIYRGSLNTSLIRIGEIFRPAIEAPAAAVIVAHNHPSGQVNPSSQDIDVTRKIIEAGKLLNITVLDHLIIGQGIYMSFKERELCFD